MEFVQLLIISLVVLLLIFKPAKENLAWWLLIVSWVSVVFMYVGHVSTSIFGMPNI